MGFIIELQGGGRLTVTEEGQTVRFEAICPDDKRGLYKIWISGTQGKTLLGTLAPVGEQLCLCRRMSRDSLERAGCWPVKSGQRVLAFTFEQENREWVQENCPERLVKEPDLRQALRERRMLCRKRRDGGFCLADRFDPGRPFPVPALFCVCRVESFRGQPYVFFCFDREGMPVLAHDSEDFGTK